MKRDYSSKIKTISELVYEDVLDYLTDAVFDQMEEFGIDVESDDFSAIHDEICSRVIKSLQT